MICSCHPLLLRHFYICNTPVYTPSLFKPNQKSVFHSYFLLVLWTWCIYTCPTSWSSLQLWLPWHLFKWFSSFIHDIAFSASTMGSYLPMTLKRAIHQGSIFGPDRFSWYHSQDINLLIPCISNQLYLLTFKARSMTLNIGIQFYLVHFLKYCTVDSISLSPKWTIIYL